MDEATELSRRLSVPRTVIPPFRFAIVEEQLYRGGHPTLKNFRHLRRLRLRTIVSLLPYPANPDLVEFCAHENIHLQHFTTLSSKEKVRIRTSAVVAALQFIADASNQPLYLHCEDGIAVTGIVVMCLRKLQRWNLAGIFAEYSRFTRGGEISRAETQFVESFKLPPLQPAHLPPWLAVAHPVMVAGHAAGGAPVEAAPSAAAPQRSQQARDSGEIEILRQELLRRDPAGSRAERIVRELGPEREWPRDLRALDLHVAPGGSGST